MLDGSPVETRPATYFTSGEYCRMSLSRASGEAESLYSCHSPVRATCAASAASGSRTLVLPADEVPGRCVIALPIARPPSLNLELRQGRGTRLTDDVEAPAPQVLVLSISGGLPPASGWYKRTTASD